MNSRYSVSLSLAILSVAALISGSTATTMVYASHHSTSSSNGGLVSHRDRIYIIKAGRMKAKLVEYGDSRVSARSIANIMNTN
jgi:hypothetical protein